MHLVGVNHVLHAQATFVDESPPWTLDQIAGLAFGVRTGSEISHWLSFSGSYRYSSLWIEVECLGR